MTYSELQRAGEAMTPEEVNANIKSLMGDSRFAAVVAWLDRNREAMIAAGCSQKLATNHGTLAHAQGSVHTLRTMEGQLRGLLEPAPRRGPAPPPEP
jgi:D-aminopeptidase